VTVVRIGSRLVGDAQPVFFLAEMSGNHNGSLARALEIVDAAAESGAFGIKLQTFRADTLTLEERRPTFAIPSTGTPWSGQFLWDLYEQAHTPWDWHEPLFERARAHGLACISTAFDAESVDFLVACEVDAIKIASFELIHVPLLQYASATGLPLIVSTGMGSEEEVRGAVSTVRSFGSPLVLLKSTSAYPSAPRDANVRAIPVMKEQYDALVGLSDHTLSLGVVAAATALGACLVEKHLTLSRADGGPDASFSLEPWEFAEAVRVSHDAAAALGSADLVARDVELASLWERPSVWVTSDIRRGDCFSEQNIRVLRPSGGLAPRLYGEVVGMVASSDIKRATPLKMEHVRGMATHSAMGGTR
jgi:pseudaminic acid synthase